MSNNPAGIRKWLEKIEQQQQQLNQITSLIASIEAQLKAVQGPNDEIARLTQQMGSMRTEISSQAESFRQTQNAVNKLYEIFQEK